MADGSDRGPIIWLGVALLVGILLSIARNQSKITGSMHESALGSDEGVVSSKTSQEPTMLSRLGLARVLVLRLPRAANRSNGLIEDAQRLGIPLEFMDSSDGVYEERFRSRVMPLTLPDGGTCADIVGSIFDTHERAWGLVAKDSHLPTLVLEDDVRLPDDFVKLFTERLNSLPAKYHMAFAGTSFTPQAKSISQLIVEPDADDANMQAVLGFWAYVMTPKGAKRLLKFVNHERRGGRRFFQPVDLFIAHRLHQIKVFGFQPPAHLQRDFELHPDRHHVLETMRQIGVVKIAKIPSTNAPVEDEENTEMKRFGEMVTQHGQAGKAADSWKVARKAFKKVERYSCWNMASMLQNAGLSLMHVLQAKKDGLSSLGGANQTLLVALEAFASSIRYNEGTWMERKKKGEFPSWINHALHSRRQSGFPEIIPPDGWGSRVPLPGGGWLEAKSPPTITEVRKPETSSG